jgi:hypothetical protein
MNQKYFVFEEINENYKFQQNIYFHNWNQK